MLINTTKEIENLPSKKVNFQKKLNYLTKKLNIKYKYHQIKIGLILIR